MDTDEDRWMLNKNCAHTKGYLLNCQPDVKLIEGGEKKTCCYCYFFWYCGQLFKMQTPYSVSNMELR